MSFRELLIDLHCSAPIMDRERDDTQERKERQCTPLKEKKTKSENKQEIPYLYSHPS
jgi:hypothetical protein